MLIIQKPEGLHFENNIPDIVLQKQSTEASIDIVFKTELDVILQENYKFDADGMITVRNLKEIASAYLIAQKTALEDKVITTGLIQKFTFEIKYVSSIVVEFSGIDNYDQLLIEQMSIPGNLSDWMSVGDKLYKIGSTNTNFLITSIDDQTFTVTLNGDVSAYADGAFAYFETYRTVEIPFFVLRCEADMPAWLNAGTFAEQNFLTRLASEKRTDTNQNEYLSYIHFDTYADVVVKYKAVYDLAGVRTEKIGTFLTIQAQAQNSIITFNASLAKLRAIANLQNEYIYQYDIWFTEDAVSVQSNIFTFLVTDVYYRNSKYFVFENSFGVLETFMATGIVNVKKNVEMNLASIRGRYRKTTQDFTAETTLNTGFLSDSEMDWLDDLILSYNVALYTPGVSGADEEITLTESDKTDTEANELQSFSFSYRKANNNNLQFTTAARKIFDPTFDSTFN